MSGASADTWTARADAHRRAGRWTDAAAAGRPALALAPADDAAWAAFAMALAKAKRPGAAEAALRAVRLAPESVDAWTARAMALATIGRTGEALAAFRRGVVLAPDSAASWANAVVLLNRMDAAQACRRAAAAAVALQPDLAAAPGLAAPLSARRLADAQAARRDNRLAEAEAACREAIALAPDRVEAQVAMGQVLNLRGHCDAASVTFERALRHDPGSAAARLGVCMAQLPVVYRSDAEVEQRRAAYERALAALHHRLTSAPAAERAAAAPALGSSLPFLLAYQGREDRDIQRLYGDLVHRLVASRRPDLAQRPDTPPPAPGEPIRVGFLSAYFHHHSVWKIPLRGWLEGLDPERFAIHGYDTDGRSDAETAVAERLCRGFVRGPLPMDAWAEAIRRDRLHVLVIPEVGMDPVSSVLAALRLAPVQLAGPGHPVTTGLPTVDGFLTSDLMEPPDAERHYTERLLRLPNLGNAYVPIVQPQERLERATVGLEADDIVFWCCQTLFKYLPAHDGLLVRIAERVPRARFLFIGHARSPMVTDVFAQRLTAAFARRGLDAARHCRILPPMSPERFSAVATLCDVFLDNPGWSGNNTAMESLACGLPIVTWPGPLMRMRHAAAILTRLGVTETIAGSADEYVEIAVRLGLDRGWRAALAERLAAGLPRLYDDPAPAAALADILTRAALAGRLA